MPSSSPADTVKQIATQLQAVAKAMDANPDLKGALPAFLAKILAAVKDPQIIAALLPLIAGLFGGTASASSDAAQRAATHLQSVAASMDENPDLKGALPAFLEKILSVLKDPQVLAAIVALVSSLFGGNTPTPGPVNPLPVNPFPVGPVGGDKVS